MFRYSQIRETDNGASSISSTPHSRASHHNSGLRVGLTSATRMGFRMCLSRSTKSLQFPSLSANSVTTTVPLGVETSKAVAALILDAQRTLIPSASISFSISGAVLVTHSTIVVFAGSSGCIVLITLLQGSQVDSRLAVSCRKLFRLAFGVQTRWGEAPERRIHVLSVTGLRDRCSVLGRCACRAVLFGVRRFLRRDCRPLKCYGVDCCRI
jgi:hypothetical protein